MIYKPRTKSTELIRLGILKKRMNLSKEDQQHYFNLKKGYEGEVLFDSLTEKLQCECLILNDLLLKLNYTTFQIDSLIIANGKIYFYEVKNLEGDYYYEEGKFYKKPNREILNPLDQLSRSQALLQQLILNHGFKLPIDASVVFINPSFTLYQAPLDKPIIFTAQLKNYLAKLNATHSVITDKHKKLAEKLVALHRRDSPFQQIPSYKYNDLRKGITCVKCHSFSLTVGERNYTCNKCKYKESIDKPILRNIQEFKILFPNERMTTTIIHDWCQVVKSKRKIRTILLKNFTQRGSRRWAHYI